MCETRSTYGRRRACSALVGKREEKIDNLEDLYIDERILLKRISKIWIDLA
jgi:hypothetical protein